MLKTLTLQGVGPAKAFGSVEFASRLNFITGDNGQSWIPRDQIRAIEAWQNAPTSR